MPGRAECGVTRCSLPERKPSRCTATIRRTMVRPRSATKTHEETEKKPTTRLAPTWNVVVHDDPVTLMSYVTNVFMTVFGYAEHKARQLMMEVHTKGRSVVWTGAREQAETYVQKLIGFHLLATLESAGT